MEKKDYDLKYSKLKIHTGYIVGIAIGISICSLVVAGHGDSAFVSQFAFASTVTSIVLSVIAIWLSISGERQLNDVRCKIVDATDGLTKSTQGIQVANENNQKILEQQISSFENIHTKMETIFNTVNTIKKDFGNYTQNLDSLISSTNTLNSTDTNNSIDYNSLISQIRNQQTDLGKILFDIALKLFYDLKIMHIIDEIDDSYFNSLRSIIHEKCPQKSSEEELNRLYAVVGIYMCIKGIGLNDSNFNFTEYF